MKSQTLTAADLNKEGVFYNFVIDSRAVSFYYDMGADIRYWWVPIQTFLEAAISEKVIIDYDMRAGRVSLWKGRDDYAEWSAGEWLQYFVTDGDERALQSVTRLAAKNDLESRIEMLKSIEQ